MALKPPQEDFWLEISRRSRDGMEHLNVFGHNNDIDIAETPKIITAVDGAYSFPTSGQIHNLRSSSTGDVGQVKSSGTWNNKSLVLLVDPDATFVSDGVTAGDLVLNDTIHDYSYVNSVDSETQLTLASMHDKTFSTVGDSYRVIHPLGSGASVVNISRAVDQNFNSTQEFVVLNGTGGVNTSETFMRIDRAHCLGAGTAEMNGGNINISGLADGIVTNKINYSIGQTEHAAYSVPQGKEAYITSIWAVVNKVAGNPAGAYGNIGLFEHGYPNTPTHSDGRRQRQGFTVGIGSPFDRHPLPPIRFREITDIWLQANVVSDNDSDLTAGFDVVIVDR